MRPVDLEIRVKDHFCFRIPLVNYKDYIMLRYDIWDDYAEEGVSERAKMRFPPLLYYIILIPT